MSDNYWIPFIREQSEQDQTPIEGREFSEYELMQAITSKIKRIKIVGFEYIPDAFEATWSPVVHLSHNNNHVKLRITPEVTTKDRLEDFLSYELRRVVMRFAEDYFLHGD